MDLRTAYPISLLTRGIIRSYPSLNRDIRTDIAVIGAGVTGALVAYHLAEAGFEVTVIDRRHVGMGSTAASTGLLQYEIDIPLYKLALKIGVEKANLSYIHCRQAIYDLKKICSELNLPTDFKLTPSLQFASFKSSVKDLEKEFKARKEAGLDVQWMNEEELSALFGFKRPAALFSEDGGQVDAYSLTHSLFESLVDKIHIYDHTEVHTIDSAKNSVELKTTSGYRINCRKVIIACGYESGKYIPFQTQKLHSTYCIASEPMRDKKIWYRNSLIWETQEPYIYLRTSADHRILIGGKDDAFSDPGKRDAALNRKAVLLENSFRKLFPAIPFRTDFKWGGVFASTKDGLPYIGRIRHRPHHYFALGYGGNGITFSVLAAQIITDELKGKKNKASALFHFDR